MKKDNFLNYLVYVLPFLLMLLSSFILGSNADPADGSGFGD
ncbi:MAG: hypothetical protein ACXAB7_04975 [Candidatus Kariarchaeaceae archaeon]